jgi:hypothetical protein
LASQAKLRASSGGILTEYPGTSSRPINMTSASASAVIKILTLI